MQALKSRGFYCISISYHFQFIEYFFSEKYSHRKQPALQETLIHFKSFKGGKLCKEWKETAK